MSSNRRKDVLALLRAVQRPEHGCTVEPTNKNHWKVTKPGKPVVTVSGKAGDPCALRNIRADLARYLDVRV